MEYPKVSIIILNWNGWSDTIECLNSLSKIDYPNYEVVLVDNNSKDESVEKILEWIAEKKSVIPIYFIKNDENYGFAKGNNIAIKKVLDKGDSEYILLLNNDTVVEKKFLNELVDVAKTDQKIGIVGPKILNYKKNEEDIETIQSLGGVINLWTGNVSMICSGHKNFQSTIKDVKYLRGAGILIKKDVFKKIGLLEEKYFAYFEETDFCFNTKKEQFLIKIVPNSIIWHKGMSSFNKISGFSLYLMTRNLFWFEKKYASNFQFLIFIIYFFTIKFPKKLIFLTVSNKTNNDVIKKYILGIKEGFLKKI